MKTAWLIPVLLVAACGADPGESQPASEVRENTREDRETVFDPMVSNIDKAKAVEQQVLDQKKKMDDVIDGDQ